MRVLELSLASLFLPLGCLVQGTVATPAPILGLVSNILGPILTKTDACNAIGQVISDKSKLYWPGSLGYAKDTYHWATTSSDIAACSVEPGTPEDVAKILLVLGNSSTPFAVKGGGHTANPGFSSTTGVQIAMSRFNQVTYNAEKETATIGAGLVWDEVYEALEPYGVNVVGGRVKGVGVAGFTLGGGYSWLTNQYGLTVDTVVTFNMVLPNGDITAVTEKSDPELFFSLKGGQNNFGIVTSFELKTFPQGTCWGGLIMITEPYLLELLEATARFSAENNDPKAAIITTINTLSASVLSAPGASLLLFYDGPEPPAGTFDDFLAIKYFTKDVKTRSFLEVVSSSPSEATNNMRGAFHTVPNMKYDVEYLKIAMNESMFYGEKLGPLGASFISYQIEPFITDVISRGPESAYPPIRDTVYLPTNIYYVWTLSATDSIMRSSLETSAKYLLKRATELGQTGIENAGKYTNYALSGVTKVEEIYGSAHVNRMRAVRDRVDPARVMDLAGGWKI